jgi:hypothetical protein
MQSTVLRYLASKDLEKVLGAVALLGFKIEYKEIKLLKNKYYLFFTLDDHRGDFPSIDLDKRSLENAS